MNYRCQVTPFRGFEQDILRLRNANREWQETLGYLNWRYSCPPDAPSPAVFWLQLDTGERIGVASVIFRPYWVDSRRVYVPVVGDISLGNAWRGRGLGQVLLQFMTDYLDEHYPEHPAFVIPTEAARRTLARIGWTTPGMLVPYVYLVEPAMYVRRAVRSAWLAGRIARQAKRLARLIASGHVERGRSLDLVDELDGALIDFVREPPRIRGTAIHDVGADFLNWRYARHPRIKFKIAKLVDHGRVAGFLVFEDERADRSCSIYELAAATPADLRSMIALFILRAFADADVATLRVLLDDRHPARACLRRLGFIPRRAEAVFQVHSRGGVAERIAWQVTSGDKDA